MRHTGFERAAEVHATHAEGAFWDDRSQEILWVDMLHGRILATSFRTGHTRSRQIGSPVAAVVRPRQGRDGWIVARERDVVTVERWDGPPTLVTQLIAEVGTRLNEGTCDPSGGLLIGGTSVDDAPRRSRLWRVGPDSQSRVVLEPVSISNGIAFLPDGDAAYVDSPTRRIDRLRFDDDGAVERNPFIAIEDDAGLPDGIAADSEGGVWVAMWGGAEVRRYSSDGELDARIGVAAPLVTSCAFVGPDLSQLAITTSRLGQLEDADGGRLFVRDIGVRGARTYAFAA